MFSDAVYVMALATAVCRMMLTVPRGLTVSRVSITKASGLSDAPGAERSPGGKTGDTVTYVTRIIVSYCASNSMSKASMEMVQLCFVVSSTSGWILSTGTK